MLKRENTEWSQFYWFDIPQTDLPRVMLIGDSIVAGSRGFTVEKLRGTATVAAYSTSKVAGDPAISRELGFAFSEYPVDLVCFNNGLHGLDVDDESYRDGLVEMVELLRIATRAKLLWRSSTPITVKGKPEEFDPKLNPVVLRRNAIAVEEMTKLGIPCDDLYAAVAGHPEFSAGDGFHYNSNGYIAIAEHVAAAISTALASR